MLFSRRPIKIKWGIKEVEFRVTEVPYTGILLIDNDRTLYKEPLKPDAQQIINLCGLRLQ